MSVASDKRKALVVLTGANLLSCPLYLGVWFVAYLHDIQGLSQISLALAAACIVLPIASWALAGPRPRAAFTAILTPLAPVAAGFVFATLVSVAMSVERLLWGFGALRTN